MLIASLISMLSAFQFTPLREGLLRTGTMFKATIEFQFTPLREGLQSLTRLSFFIFYFNSRPCERGFQNQSTPSQLAPISIHAPARGASLRTHTSVSEDKKFQFTPLREGLQKNRQESRLQYAISIHAPARGASGGYPSLFLPI